VKVSSKIKESNLWCLSNKYVQEVMGMGMDTQRQAINI